MFKRQAKSLIRLCIWAGWSEALLVAQTTLLEIWCLFALWQYIVNTFISCISNNCIVARWLVNVIYLISCTCIRSLQHRLLMTTTMKLNVTKIDYYVKIAHLKSKPTCKLIKRIPGSLFYIKFTRLNFESAYWTARQALQFIKRSGKPCLVNLISKDTHLECFIYTLFHYFITGQKSKNCSTSDLVSYIDRSSSYSLMDCTQWLV